MKTQGISATVVFASWAIRDALIRNLKEGRFVLGASTISMQLTKNIFLHREKTLARKVQEVVLTWWLEHELTKDEILELYLNVIEYGPGCIRYYPCVSLLLRTTASRVESLPKGRFWRVYCRRLSGSTRATNEVP